MKNVTNNHTKVVIKTTKGNRKYSGINPDSPNKKNEI